jgi:hypothetical protein
MFGNGLIRIQVENAEGCTQIWGVEQKAARRYGGVEQKASHRYGEQNRDRAARRYGE